MSWEGVEAIASVAAVVGAGLTWLMMRSVHEAILGLKVEIAAQRAKDREDTQRWVEDRFVRRQSG